MAINVSVQYNGGLLPGIIFVRQTFASVLQVTVSMGVGDASLDM